MRCVIADTSARAFVFNHYGHMSSKPCSKCKIEGYRCTVPGFEGTIIFPGIKHLLRTDEEYNNLLDEDDHNVRRPLSALLGLVSRVPFEIMHLVYMGTAKKLMSTHVQGKYVVDN